MEYKRFFPFCLVFFVWCDVISTHKKNTNKSQKKMGTHIHIKSTLSLSQDCMIIKICVHLIVIQAARPLSRVLLFINSVDSFCILLFSRESNSPGKFPWKALCVFDKLNKAEEWRTLILCLMHTRPDQTTKHQNNNPRKKNKVIKIQPKPELSSLAWFFGLTSCDFIFCKEKRLVMMAKWDIKIVHVFCRQHYEWKTENVYLNWLCRYFFHLYYVMLHNKAMNMEYSMQLVLV